MSVDSNSLERHLKEETSLAYLVLNDEPRLLSEDRDLIRKALSCDDRTLFLVDASFDPDEARAEVGTGNLFGGRTLLEFLCAEPIAAKAAEPICDIAEQAVREGDAVIVASPVVARKKGKWYDRLVETFTVVEGKHVPFERMPGWVKARAAKIGLKLDDEAAELLASMTEGNLSMAAQELEKLQILRGDDAGEIGAGTVREGLADQTRDDLYSLRESMADGDALRAVRAVRNLEATKEAPVLVCWALAEEGRALLTMIDGGKGVWGISSGHRNNLKDLSARLKRSDAEAYMSGVARADRATKGLDGADPWLLMERLACAFSMMAKNNRLDANLLR